MIPHTDIGILNATSTQSSDLFWLRADAVRGTLPRKRRAADRRTLSISISLPTPSRSRSFILGSSSTSLLHKKHVVASPHLFLVSWCWAQALYSHEWRLHVLLILKVKGSGDITSRAPSEIANISPPNGDVVGAAPAAVGSVRVQRARQTHASWTMAARQAQCSIRPHWHYPVGSFRPMDGWGLLHALINSKVVAECSMLATRHIISLSQPAWARLAAPLVPLRPSPFR